MASSLSARSVYSRFFNAKRRLSDDELRRFTELDLNPVKIFAPGRGAVVVDGRMRVART